VNCCFDLTHIIQHFASAGAAFLGGSSMMVYAAPGTFKEALVRILVSVGAGVTLAPAITRKIFDDSITDTHVVAGVAFGVGFCAWSSLGAIAAYFQHRKGQDVVQLYQGVKHD